MRTKTLKRKKNDRIIIDMIVYKEVKYEQEVPGIHA